MTQCEIRKCISCGRKFQSCNGMTICGECKKAQDTLRTNVKKPPFHLYGKCAQG